MKAAEAKKIKKKKKKNTQFDRFCIR